MGPTFGKVSHPKAVYERIQLFPIEVRTYPPTFVAEIICNDEEIIEASQALMDYIGFTGDPHNMKAAQTTPGDPIVQVVNLPAKIDLTVPVLREDRSLTLILPPEYTVIDAIPVPTDSRITVKEIPERTVAVQKFKGGASRKQYMHYVNVLRAKLEGENMLGVSTVVSSVPAATAEPVPEAGATKHDLLSKPTEAELGQPRLSVPSAEANKWIIAQYNSTATLPFLRKNEVWIELDVANTQVAKILERKALQKVTQI